MTKKILLIGWHPTAVDYDKYPGLTPERLEASLRGDEAALQAQGHDARLGFIHAADTAEATVAELLDAEAFDIVLIGAGVRKDDACFLTFERLVNTVHAHAPGARIAFNTGPTDTAEAVARWL